MPLAAHLSEMLEDVVDDDLLRLVRVHPGERVHVDDSIFKSNERKAQGAFQGLDAQETDGTLKEPACFSRRGCSTPLHTRSLVLTFRSGGSL